MKPSLTAQFTLAREVQVLLHPFSTFALIAGDTREGPSRLASRVALLLFVIGIAVSVLTCGRVSLHHVIGSMLAWCFAPAIQLIAASAGIHLTAKGQDLRRLLSIYSAGNGPWLLLFTLLPFALVLAPDKDAVVRIGLERGVVPVVVFATLASGVTLTFAFHRSAIGAPPGRAAAATLIDLLVKVVLSLTWFGWMDNLIPQLFGADR